MPNPYKETERVIDKFGATVYRLKEDAAQQDRIAEVEQEVGILGPQHLYPGF